MAIFNGWHLPVLSCFYSPFQKNKTLESWHNCLFINWSRLLDWKGPVYNLTPVLQIVKKIMKNFTLVYIHELTKYGDLMIFISKNIFKNAPCLMYWYSSWRHRFGNHGSVENTKTWISAEQNITFLRNEKSLNVYLKWHILRSSCFVAKVTFKVS